MSLRSFGSRICICAILDVNIELRDIKSGAFTYGERIELERIIRAEISDYERIYEVVQCLHDVRIEPENAVALEPYVARVLTDIAEWIEREQKELYIPPTNEEIQAGIEEFAKACGTIGNVVSLAERFCCTFEEIYKRPYLEVYAILKVSAERTKFERRLNDVYRNKK